MGLDSNIQNIYTQGVFILFLSFNKNFDFIALVSTILYFKELLMKILSIIKSHMFPVILENFFIKLKLTLFQNLKKNMDYLTFLDFS
jgi:hypothetical protein